MRKCKLSYYNNYYGRGDTSFLNGDETYQDSSVQIIFTTKLNRHLNVKCSNVQELKTSKCIGVSVCDYLQVMQDVNLMQN